MVLPRDATQSAVMPQQVVRPSVRPSVCLSVCESVSLRYDFSHGLEMEYFENNFTAE